MPRYAVAFDLDTSVLETEYHNDSWRNAYNDIRKVFEEDYDFIRMQQTIYFSQDEVSPVDCVLLVQDLAGRFPWFTSSVKDIRMLRIEETSDLRPAISTNRKKRIKGKN